MSADAFATLRPSNALATLAFSDLFETFTAKGQNAKDDPSPAFRRMVVEALQTFDSEVLQLRLEDERRRSQKADASDAETIESMPDSETEDQRQELGNVWAGHYELRLKLTPATSERGYTVGKGPLENVPLDLLLCTKSFAKSHGINLRNPHARFSFFRENRGFYIANSSRSHSAQLTVNGETVQRRPYALNQHSMIIRFDKLEYTFQWTEFAATKTFMQDRSDHVIKGLDGPEQVDIDMPTPLPNRRTIGSWTLGDALGRGGFGKVFFGSNSLGEVAAVKMMDRTGQNHRIIDAEVQTCQDITTFAEKSDKERRILRVVEVLYTKDKIFSPTVVFDQVAVVLQPVVTENFHDMCGAKSKGGAKGMKIEAAVAFRDALLGLQTMHHGGWMHRDLKPSNIGLVGTPARAILLDNGASLYLKPGCLMPAQPGSAGTIGYLAPEFESSYYDHRIDIWSMGIILYWLTYNVHPWTTATNPFNGKDDKKVMMEFESSYWKATDRMMAHYNAARQAPTEGYIHLGSLFVEMVKYGRSLYRKHRLDIDDVLNHPAWGPLLPDAEKTKRPRLSTSEVAEEA